MKWRLYRLRMAIRAWLGAASQDDHLAVRRSIWNLDYDYHSRKLTIDRHIDLIHEKINAIENQIRILALRSAKDAIERVDRDARNSA
jgi:hypothetical protein